MLLPYTRNTFLPSREGVTWHESHLRERREWAKCSHWKYVQYDGPPSSLFQLSPLLTGHALAPYLYSGHPQTEFNTLNFISDAKGWGGEEDIWSHHAKNNSTLQELVGHVNLIWVIWVALASTSHESQHNADKKSPDPFTHLHCCIIMTVFIVLINNHNSALINLVQKNMWVIWVLLR